MALFQFELISPESLLVSEGVVRVVVPGAEGIFSVLSGHAPLISALRPGILALTRQNGSVQKYYLSGGFVEVNPEKLVVLTEQALLFETLDLKEIEQSIQNCLEDRADAEDEAARQSAELELARLRDIAQALQAEMRSASA